MGVLSLILARAFPLYQWARWRPNAARRKRSNTVRSYEERIYSQHGEDGIIAELCYRLGVGKGFFVEFGIENGSECNTALLARNYGWRGLMIESDEAFHRTATANYRDYPAVTIRRDFVNAENIAQIFADEGVPNDFDLLSIDIDGNDYWIWKALSGYHPKVVVIEYNCYYEPPIERVIAYNPDHRWKGDWNYGASLAALESLGRRLGYSLIAAERSGVNSFFVRDDLVPQIGFPVVTAAEAHKTATPVMYWARAKPSGPWAKQL